MAPCTSPRPTQRATTSHKQLQTTLRAAHSLSIVIVLRASQIGTSYTTSINTTVWRRPRTSTSTVSLLKVLFSHWIQIRFTRSRWTPRWSLRRSSSPPWLTPPPRAPTPRDTTLSRRTPRLKGSTITTNWTSSTTPLCTCQQTTRSTRVPASPRSNAILEFRIKHKPLR